MERRKLYDLTYEISSKRGEDDFELPMTILQVSLLDETRKPVGFLMSVPTENIIIEVMPEQIPILISVIQKLEKDLVEENKYLIDKVAKINRKNISICINMTNELVGNPTTFEEFEKELLVLLSKYNLTGLIENFTTGRSFDFPKEEKEKDYKV